MGGISTVQIGGGCCPFPLCVVPVRAEHRAGGGVMAVRLCNGALSSLPRTCVLPSFWSANIDFSHGNKTVDLLLWEPNCSVAQLLPNFFLFIQATTTPTRAHGVKILSLRLLDQFCI